MAEYTVTEVLAAYDALYGKKRYAFKTAETGEMSLSCFAVPDSIVVGKTLVGDITDVVRDGKTFHNFTFAKKGDTPQRDRSPAAKDPGLAEIKNILTLQLLPVLKWMEEKVREAWGD